MKKINNILFISGDGVNGSNNKWPLYYKYFDSYNKNYFIIKALKSIGNKSEILNFSFSLRHPKLILKLEYESISGTTLIRLKLIEIINYFIHQIILKKLKKNFYDYIIFSENTYFLNKELIERIRNLANIRVILFAGISPKNYLTKLQKKSVPHFDNIFISDSGHEKEWKQYGAKKINVLPLSAGCPKTFQGINSKYNSKINYDIVFVGRLDGDLNDYRLKILNSLICNGIDINIWTWHMSKKYLNKYPLVRNNVMGSAYGEKMIKIYSDAKIVLNIHNPSVPFGGNMRLFEIPATNSFQIADKCPKDWFINGDEIILFKNNQDLLDKVSYYLHHDKERLRIARNGYKRLLKEHTYEHRMKKFLKIVQG